jgi:hypothetical protein
MPWIGINKTIRETVAYIIKTLSGVNKLKHFLALSLLVTFSLNAFSIDNPQQSNKEAYKECKAC